MNKNELRKKIENLIEQSDIIKKEEYIQPSQEFPFIPCIAGPKCNQWFYEIKIINDRHLNAYPLHDTINQIYNDKDNFSSFDKMVSILKTILNDNEFWIE